jgi:light-regulated signal transduction histidine kinase (bacteriophytochrome)
MDNIDGASVFFVQDQGIGFAMNYAAKIFHPFERLHLDSEFDGNGIGLATVKRIVELHGGAIWVTSAIGVGSTFYFTLSSADSALHGPANK